MDDVTTAPAAEVLAFDDIENARMQLCLSQSELCREAGISQATYTRLRHPGTGARRLTLRRLTRAVRTLQNSVRS